MSCSKHPKCFNNPCHCGPCNCIIKGCPRNKTVTTSVNEEVVIDTKCFKKFKTDFPIFSDQGGVVNEYPLKRGSLVYTPPLDFVGTDGFVYYIINKKCEKTKN